MVVLVCRVLTHPSNLSDLPMRRVSEPRSTRVARATRNSNESLPSLSRTTRRQQQPPRQHQLSSSRATSRRGSDVVARRRQRRRAIYGTANSRSSNSSLSVRSSTVALLHCEHPLPQQATMISKQERRFSTLDGIHSWFVSFRSTWF